MDKRIPVAFVASLFFYGIPKWVCSQQGDTIYYDNGAVQEIWPYDKKGKLSGDYFLFWPDGKILKCGRFKNGKPVGIWHTYFKSGRPKSYGRFTLRGEPDPDLDFITLNVRVRMYRKGPWYFYEDCENSIPKVKTYKR